MTLRQLHVETLDAPPKYLDPQGLVALWREALLAQRVLQGRTRGYRSHPQLHRFREAEDPLAAIAAFLRGVHAEAIARGYAFDEQLIGGDGIHPQIPTARGQLLFEVQHLRAKLGKRSPALVARLDRDRWRIRCFGSFAVTWKPGSERLAKHRDSRPLPAVPSPLRDWRTACSALSGRFPLTGKRMAPRRRQGGHDA